MPKMLNKPIMDWLEEEIDYQSRKNDKSAKTLLLKKIEVYLKNQIKKDGEAQILMAIRDVCKTKAQKKPSINYYLLDDFLIGSKRLYGLESKRKQKDLTCRMEDLMVIKRLLKRLLRLEKPTLPFKSHFLSRSL